MSLLEFDGRQGSRQLQLAMLLKCSRTVRLLQGRPDGHGTSRLWDRPDSTACCGPCQLWRTAMGTVDIATIHGYFYQVPNYMA